MYFNKILLMSMSTLCFLVHQAAAMNNTQEGVEGGIEHQHSQRTPVLGNLETSEHERRSVAATSGANVTHLSKHCAPTFHYLRTTGNQASDDALVAYILKDHGWDTLNAIDQQEIIHHVTTRGFTSAEASSTDTHLQGEGRVVRETRKAFRKAEAAVAGTEIAPLLNTVRPLVVEVANVAQGAKDLFSAFFKKK